MCATAALGTSATPAQDTLPGPGGAAPAAVSPEQQFAKQLSYALGMTIGRDLGQNQAPIDIGSFMAGMSDALTGAPPKMSEEEVGRTLQQFQQMAQQRAQAMAVQNKRKGEAFLIANASKEGVKSTASGLQYRVLKTGAGATPTKTDTVRCHYEGRLINGTVFDASTRHGDEPATFPVGGVISGWTEALQLMKVGDKWELYIPSNLAYGPRGFPPDIGPNETLIFTLELVGVVPKT